MHVLWILEVLFWNLTFGCVLSPWHQLGSLQVQIDGALLMLITSDKDFRLYHGYNTLPVYKLYTASNSRETVTYSMYLGATQAVSKQSFCKSFLHLENGGNIRIADFFHVLLHWLRAIGSKSAVFWLFSERFSWLWPVSQSSTLPLRVIFFFFSICELYIYWSAFPDMCKRCFYLEFIWTQCIKKRGLGNGAEGKR